MNFAFRPLPSLFLATIAALIFITSCAKAGQAIVGDTRNSSSQWSDFFHAPPGTFHANSGYRISFDYKVVARNSDAYFYYCVNDDSQAHRSFDWQAWTGQPGETGQIKSIFVDRDTDTYDMVIGIHDQAAIQVTNVLIAADPYLKPVDIQYPNPRRTWTAPPNTTYYVDSRLGSDSASGTSKSRPWQSLSKVNSSIFAPGDKILLKSGSTWTSYLAPAGSGSPSNPIVIAAYGSGLKPHIDGSGLWEAALYIANSSYITVRGLDIENQGHEAQPKLTGISINETNCGTAHKIILDNLTIHDVTGSELKSEGGGAAIDTNCIGDRTPTRFDGLTVENCTIFHTDRDGIIMHGAWLRNAWFPSLHVLIRNNYLSDIGGDGIVPWGCDGAVVEYNTVAGARMRTTDNAAGIWPWSCDNTIVQFNDVSGVKGVDDGEGFDSDYNCQHSVFQYNFSHNNSGGFILICDDGTTYPPYNIGNIGTIVRYNISVNDKQYTFSVAGRVTNTQIYNNTVYLGTGSANRLLNGGEWGGWPDNTKFTNNIFVSNHPVDIYFGQMTNTYFLRNAYSGHFINAAKDPKAITTNLKLLNPGGTAPSDYRPGRKSPLIDAGVEIDGNGGRDYGGAAVQQHSEPTIGAYQK